MEDTTLFSSSLVPIQFSSFPTSRLKGRITLPTAMFRVSRFDPSFCRYGHDGAVVAARRARSPRVDDWTHAHARPVSYFIFLHRPHQIPVKLNRESASETTPPVPLPPLLPPTILSACPPGVHDDPDAVRHPILNNPRRDRPHDETYLGNRSYDSAGSRVQAALRRCAADSRDGSLLAAFPAAAAA